MAAIVSIAVGAIGTMVGTAIGAAIGGTILGISAATIGGVIGAGIAGGLLASATGGSFGKGFLMGAAGAAIGGFVKAGLGGGTAAGGATMAADGTTTAEMMASQGGADFAPNALSNGVAGDMTAGASSGMGDIAQGASTGVSTFGDTAAAAPTGTALDATPTSSSYSPTSAGGSSLDAGVQDAAMGSGTGPASLGFSGSDPLLTGNMVSGQTAPVSGFNSSPVMGADSYSMPDSLGGNANSPMLSNDYSYAPQSSSSGPTGLDNVVSNAATTSATHASGSYPMSADGSNPSVPTTSGGSSSSSNWSLKNMMGTSDGWLKDNLGMPQGSTGKLIMGAGQYLYDKYNTDKLQRQANGMKPLSFDEFKAAYYDPDAYKAAANKMALGGHTGTLPVLLARMNDRARSDYVRYLPGAQQQNLNNQADITALRQNSLSNLFRGIGYNNNLFQPSGT